MGGGWGGLHSHFHVKPNHCVVLCCVEVRVRVGVLTISSRSSFIPNGKSDAIEDFLQFW